MFEIVEGWTDPLTAQLLKNGQAFDAEGMSVSSVVHDNRGSRVAIETEWETAGASIVRLTMTTALTAARSPYSIRFRVVDTETNVVFFPQSDPDQLIVHPR